MQPPHRLVFTWRWDGEPDETVVTVDLSPRRLRHRVVAPPRRFPDDTQRDEHVKGWLDRLDRLPVWANRPE